MDIQSITIWSDEARKIGTKSTLLGRLFGNCQKAHPSKLLIIRASVEVTLGLVTRIDHGELSSCHNECMTSLPLIIVT